MSKRSTVGKPTPSLFYRLLARLLRVFFRLLYHQFAFTYDWVAWLVSLGLWKSWVFSVIPYLTGPGILELGHGPGHLQKRLHQQGFQVFGLDASPQMGALAYQRIKKNGLSPLLVNGYAHFIPFPSDSIDQVVATFPTEYIFQLAPLKEIRRVIKPGGSLVVLPVAWITSTKPWFRLAATIFRLTGQAPVWDNHMLQPFQSAGFRVEPVEITLLTSKVILIIARKSD